MAAMLIPAAVLGVIAVGVAFALTGETPIVLTSGLSRLREDWLALPWWIGLRGLLFSPGKSLFLYSPWLLLAVPGAVLFLMRHRWHGFSITVFPALVILLYGMKLGWHGGSWGPRYLVPLIPLLSLAAAPAIQWCLQRGRRGALALALLALISTGVQLVAVGKDPEQYAAMVREFVVPQLPEGGSRFGGRDYWLARGGDGLERALQDPDPAAHERGLGYLWGYPDAELTVEVREARTFTLSLYFVDWDRQQRRQSVTLEDAGGRRTLALDHDFDAGWWASWQATATPEHPLHVSLKQEGRDTAVLSAATFDPPRGERTEEPRLDRRTAGNWRGSYGAEGYILFAWRPFNVDVQRLPPYVTRYEVSHVGDKPNPRIHVETAEDDVRDTPLLYALPFSPLLGNTWLLGADLVRAALPWRPDLLAAVLARPPWSWFGVQVAGPPHPEYGLGLDFWPTLLYTNYKSHPGLLAWMWLVLLALEAITLAGAAGLVWRLAPQKAAPRWTAALVSGLGAVLLVYNWLQVQA
jgi:hypothetical protein